MPFLVTEREYIYRDIYIYMLYAVECKLLWICVFAREIKREGETERESVSVGLSQWRWAGGGLLRGQWWPWRWGPGCGWCYSFCRGRVRPEGSIPGYPPLTAESHSPAGHRYSHQSTNTSRVISHTHSPGTFICSLCSQTKWDINCCLKTRPKCQTTGGSLQKSLRGWSQCFGFLPAGESGEATTGYYCQSDKTSLCLKTRSPKGLIF